MGPMATRISRRTALSAAAAGLVVSPAAAYAAPQGAESGRGAPLRIATYNASLNRDEPGQLLADMRGGKDPQIRAVAEVIQRTSPDILLINEFDYDGEHEAVQLFVDNYLGVAQGGATAVHYPYSFTAPVNTGVPTGLDLTGDGTTDGPDDAHGFGLFPGQYGMVVYSRFPIIKEDIRTFQELRWKSMPGNLMPDGYYPPEAERILRLSSKSHWDVPVRVGDRVLHVLAAHPTPPTFDGPEKRNQRRNFDEIRLWADYLRPGARSRWITDDAGRRGGITPGEPFVILGDYNSDPYDGDSWPGAIDQLLHHPAIRDPRPSSAGALEASELQGQANDKHFGDPARDTADFTDSPSPGNLRVDYTLPSKSLAVVGSGVFWPTSSDPLSRLTGTAPFPTSDHRLVHVDVHVPGA